MSKTASETENSIASTPSDDIFEFRSADRTLKSAATPHLICTSHLDPVLTTRETDEYPPFLPWGTTLNALGNPGCHIAR